MSVTRIALAGRALAVSAAFACLATRSVAVARAADRIPPDVRAHAAQRVEQGYTVGLAIGVIDATGSTFDCRGTQVASEARPITETSIFEIGSITKTFTTTLLADMVARGLVGFDDPVQKYLPESVVMPARGGKQITLRDLATHRSGLPRVPDLEPKDPEDPYADYSERDLFATLSTCKLTRDPGAAYEYSNLGVGLLGWVLARRAGTTYEALVLDRICTPLDLPDTRMTLSPDQQARLAHGHADGKPVANWNFDALAGAGALRSTPRDLLRFAGANLQLEKTPISAALLTAQAGRVATGRDSAFVALGWHVSTQNGTTIYWHTGGTGGYRSFCGFVPAQERGAVVLANSVDEVQDIGMHLLEPKYELRNLRRTVAVPAATLDTYLGYYELAPGTLFHITREGEQLYAQLTGQDKLPVYAENPTDFYYKTVDAQLHFEPASDGTVEHLVLYQNGARKAMRLRNYTPPQHVEVAVDRAILAQYVGVYELGPGFQFDVQEKDGQLQVKLGGQPRLPVYPLSETKFFYKAVEAQITFVKAADGKVTSLILHQGGVDQTAKRVQ